MGAGPDTSRTALDAALAVRESADLGVALYQIAVAAQSALGAARATCYSCRPGTNIIADLYTTETHPLRRAAIESSLDRDCRELRVTEVLDGSPGGMLVVEDLSADPRLPASLSTFLGAESLMGVRLDHSSVLTDGRRTLLGALFCSFAEPRAFTGHERATLAALGTLASLALANGHLQQAAAANLARLSALEAEQAALLRVATRVALTDGSAQAAYDVAAEEVCALLGATTALVARWRGATASVLSGHGDRERLGTDLPVVAGGLVHGALHSADGPVVVGDYLQAAPDAPSRVEAERTGTRSAAAAPIRAEGRVWGVLVAAFDRPDPLDAMGRERLQHFADLVGLATTNAESRMRLVERSTMDALTDLANHRTFFDRLDEEVARAVRAGRPLALAVIDLDLFKLVNDAHGHLAGDTVLMETAHRLGSVARSVDVLGRIGGEEFAWLMPETELHEALGAAERARLIVADTPFSGVGRVTMSAGVAALGVGAEASARHLFAAADAALYRAKAAGRNRCEAARPAEAAGGTAHG